MERGRLRSRRIPADQREVYKAIGGAPHLDQFYTVYGWVVRGRMEWTALRRYPLPGARPTG